MMVILHGCILSMPSKLNIPYLDLSFENDSECRLRTNLYDERDYFNFPIVNFSFKYVATFQQHLHMEYISQKLVIIAKYICHNFLTSMSIPINNVPENRKLAIAM